METAERLKPLRAWLERVGAREMYNVLSPNRRTMIRVYLVNAQVVVVMEYVEPGKPATGWDLFIPASSVDGATVAPSDPAKRNGVAYTLDNAAMALGVDGCAGLVAEAV